MSLPIKKRINTELFIDGTAALYAILISKRVGGIRDLVRACLEIYLTGM